ncbi:hypothetical protein GGU11DRAFT_836036 [Lentinula aff. detonsa]|nr:hypothetical protein GGU11DRAFT_836036 [Lentinula aff. detonsa]
MEENRVEREKAARELEQRTKPKPRTVDVVISPRPSGSKTKVFKSKSVISDDSDVIDVDQEQVETPRGVKRKRPIKMIAQNDIAPDPTSDRDADENDNEDEESPSQPRSACTRCSWIGEHASRRSRGKRAKVEDEIYQGPAARVGERRFEGPGIAEQLAAIVGQNKDLIDIARRSLGLQERILHLLVRRERREIAREELEEEEDEDGEGEEDEEELENEEEKRAKIREGKKRAE